MTSKRISMTFIIILLGLFLIPTIFLQQEWGYQYGWVWGLFSVAVPPYTGFSFQWIWDLFLAFPSMDLLLYLGLAATVGVMVDALLLIISLKAISHRWFTSLTALLNLAFGVAAILVTLTQSINSGSLVLSPLGIFLVICGAIALIQIIKS